MQTVKIDTVQFYVPKEEDKSLQQLIDHFLFISGLLGYSIKTRYYQIHSIGYIDIQTSKQNNFFEIQFQINKPTNTLSAIVILYIKNHKIQIHELYTKNFCHAIQQIIKYI